MKRIATGLSIVLMSVLSPVHSIAASGDVLMFPKDSYTVETKTVKTSKGERKVTYRSYQRIPYVSNPVDVNYQSLNVNVPVEVDGAPVNTANAPILLKIGVGGYMSLTTARAGGARDAGGPPRGGMPPIGAPDGPPDGARNAFGPPGGPPAGGGGGGTFGPGGPGGPTGRNSNVSDNQDLALAAGYVVVLPGVRGRENKAADGNYYGKAPAAIVDLKAVVRYVRHNRGIIPGNTDRIVSVGSSASGALSALLGASANSRAYEPYLKEIGAANESDAIFASADYCPITDLDHADMAYDWMFGNLPARNGPVDPAISKRLQNAFSSYEASLKLKGRNGFGAITTDTFGSYVVQTYLIASADKFLRELTPDKRSEYLAKNPWISWSEKGAQFTFADFVKHVGRMKGQPAFDDFALKAPETTLFGNKTTDARHFTNFSLQHANGDSDTTVDRELQTVVNLMNAMYFVRQNNKSMPVNWWVRQGTSDNDTSLPVFINLVTSLENRGKRVNASMYWDGPHGADEDPEDFIAWIGAITSTRSGNQSFKQRFVARNRMR